MSGLFVIASGSTVSESVPGEVLLDDSAAVFQQTSSSSDLPAEPNPMIDGEREMRAIARAYPKIIGEVQLRDGEWALRMGDEWYYWADGRLLPRQLRDEAEQYVGIRFYNYTLGMLREKPVVPPGLEPRLRDRTDQVTSEGDDGLRFNDFLDTLYGIQSLADAERTMESVQFLGKWIRVHPLIVDPLERVETRIRAVPPQDKRVGAFIDSLGSIHAYNWRNIAGTMRRSYHSYGVALDIVPRSYSGRWAYWLWAAEAGVEEWWNLDLDERLMVPEAVLDAFEAEGFVWGGKWLFFDNLHFEYRPESIIMASDRVSG